MPFRRGLFYTAEKAVASVMGNYDGRLQVKKHIRHLHGSEAERMADLAGFSQAKALARFRVDFAAER